MEEFPTQESLESFASEQEQIIYKTTDIIRSTEQNLKNISNEFLKSSVIDQFGLSNSEDIYKNLKSQEEQIKESLEQYDEMVKNIFKAVPKSPQL